MHGVDWPVWHTAPAKMSPEPQTAASPAATPVSAKPTTGAASPPPSRGLREILKSRRILVCVGSGGVGKTTTAATLGLLAALMGRKVLVLTIDPARRLADALGLSILGHDIQNVPEEKLAQVAAALAAEGDGPATMVRQPGGRLDAMMLDQKRAFDEVVERYAEGPIRQRIFKNSIYQQISASLSGSHEYAAMSKLADLSRSSSYDLFVLDTPPTANTIDFLDAPDRISQAVTSPALQWFIKPYLQAGSWSLRLVGMGGALVLRGLSRFVGSEFLSQMAEFFVEFSQVMSGFRERAEEVRALLRKPEVAFVQVCSPEPLSVEEAVFFSERLRRAQMPVGGFVVNRVHEHGPALPADLLPLLEARPELSGYMQEDLRRLADDLVRTYEEQQVLAVTDENSVARIQKIAEGVPITKVPMFERDIYDAAGIALVSRHLL